MIGLKGRKSAIDRMGNRSAAGKLSMAITGVLIFLMLLYLSLTIYSSNKLAEHTVFISSHPFEVVISIGDVKACLSEIQIRTERLAKYNSEADIELIRNALDLFYETIKEPISTIEAQYLGDPNDVQAVKGTLEKLVKELELYVILAGDAATDELEAFEAEHLYPLYGQAAVQLDEITATAQERKLWYGETAEALRKATLTGSLILMGMMIGALLLSQYVLRRQRRELVSRSLLFDNLSQSIDDAFLISDAKTGEIYYTALNMDRILGHKVKSMEDACRDFPQADTDEISKVMKDSSYVFPFVKKVKCFPVNGEERWISVRIYRADGMAEPQIISIFSDCTAEMSWQQSLEDAMANAEHANEAKSVFLSRMSHEIRTPLNAVIGMTTIAAASVHEPDKVRHCLEKIGLSSKHLLMLINDILDMSKIESNKMSVNKEPFDLFQVISSFSGTLYSQAKDKNIEFAETMEGFHGQGQYLGDSLRLNQILMNLGSNAVKFTPPEGNIRLNVSLLSSKHMVDMVRFVVTDTGIGMSKEAIQRIFKPFEQADSTITSRFGGTGLGMAITKNLVSLMNGRIEIHSEEGVGTACTIDLPFQRDDSSGEQPDFTNQGLRALVVDDEQAVCEETAALLEQIKIQPEWVMSGSAAVERVLMAQRQNRAFDFCLIDWKMPDMDGIQVTRLIRTNVGEALPIVMISAYDYTEIEEEAKKAGVNAFLPKPLYRSSVYATIKDTLFQENNYTDVQTVQNKLTGKQFLVAEDNELNREILESMLTMNQIKVDCAVNGQEALDLFIKSPVGYYDVILMDVQMPVLDGHESARQLRALERPDAKSVPIVAATANAFSADISAALEAGMNAHISKPIDFPQLYQILNELLQA